MKNISIEMLIFFYSVIFAGEKIDKYDPDEYAYSYQRPIVNVPIIRGDRPINGHHPLRQMTLRADIVVKTSGEESEDDITEIPVDLDFRLKGSTPIRRNRGIWEYLCTCCYVRRNDD